MSSLTKTAVLYRIDGPDGVYIGVTTKTLEKRFRYHLKDAFREGKPGYSSLLYQAIRRHGVEAFTISPLAKGAQDVMFDAEERAVELLGTYNQKTGGRSGRHDQATKDLISKRGLERFKDPEQRAVARRAITDAWKDPAFRERMKGRRKRSYTAEHKQRLRELIAERFATPEAREAHKAKCREAWGKRRRQKEGE